MASNRCGRCPSVQKRTFHKLSTKHLDCYVQEFAGMHNMREQDTIEQMKFVADECVENDFNTRT